MGDYHNEMDVQRFERWFMKYLLPHINLNSVIVADNSSYHSVQLEKLPSSLTRRRDIQQWLREKYIPFFADQLKADLTALANDYKYKFSRQRTDAPAKAAGHDVIRPPPH